MLVLGWRDLGNIAAEFAGIASGMGISISKYLTVPVVRGGVVCDRARPTNRWSGSSFCFR
jgi:hypothetical protein